MKGFGNSRGFTLIEVVIIVIVGAILAVVVFIKSSDFYTIKLNSAASKLASDIRFTQQMSITRQISTDKHGVVFNIPSANQYTVYEGDDPTNPARDPAGGRDFVVDYTTGEFNGVTISTPLPQDGSSRRLVKFNSKGEPLGGDGNALTAPNNTVTLTYQGNSTIVTIGAMTGRVTY